MTGRGEISSFRAAETMTDKNQTKTFAVGRDEGPAALKGAVLAIGNFDGVHRGHRKVIAAAGAQPKAVMTKLVW